MAAKMVDLNLFYQAGIDPKSGLPNRFCGRSQLKEDLKRVLRIVDEQDAVNRYQWYNLPSNLTSQELERLLYYKGQLCFFYDEQLNEFYFMPYALDGTIDLYGRFNTVHPVPVAEGIDEKTKKNQTAYLSMKKLRVVYGVKTDPLSADDITNSCVLLHDYTKQLSQTIISRQVLNDSLLDVMAEIIPFTRTAMQNQTGLAAVRVNNQDEQSNVYALNRQINDAALAGDKFLATIGSVEFQELAEGALGRPDSFMQMLESLDNFRLGLYGIDNGGVFEKKSHMLAEEQALAGGATGLVYNDGLSIRQNFCNIVNSIWPLGIWCMPSETLVGDTDGNGVAMDDQQPNQTGTTETQPEGGNEDGVL